MKSKFLYIPLVFFYLIRDALASSTENGPDLHFGIIIMGVAGGLTFFLYGMEKMSNGMKKATGVKFRKILTILTDNRIVGLTLGTFIAMIIQSSSAVTVMLVAFVQSGVMTFVQSLGVVLGASIGTTITAQLVAFKLTETALLFVVIGFFVSILSKKENVRYFGEVFFGFGLLFFGMKLMGDSIGPLRDYQGFINILKDLENPFYGILFGAIFTALIQSSSAFLGIIIILSYQGFITLEAGIPLVIGTNIGTCITAFIACVGMNREAKRVAIAHVVFKVLGAVIFVFWITPFASLIRSLNFGTELTAPRLIANAHTVYNVGLALLFLPFTNQFAKLILKFYPDIHSKYSEVPVLKYLDKNVLTTPVMAIGLARSEISRMAKILEEMLEATVAPLNTNIVPNDTKYPHLNLFEGIIAREKKIDYLEREIANYLLQVSRQELSDEQANETFALISITKDMECIGDVINSNIRPQIEKKRSLEVEFSEEGQDELKDYHKKVCKQISRVRSAFFELDPDKADNILKKYQRYLQLDSQYVVKHLRRVSSERIESLHTHEIHMELMDSFKQINVYAGNIAKRITMI